MKTTTTKASLIRKTALRSGAITCMLLALAGCGGGGHGYGDKDADPPAPPPAAATFNDIVKKLALAGPDETGTPLEFDAQTLVVDNSEGSFDGVFP